MGYIPGDEIDAHLRAGGAVVTASDRAARAIASSYDRARRAEGLHAWVTPQVSSWSTFVRNAWDEHSDGTLLPLSPVQELSVWEQVIAASRHPVSLLESSRRRVAEMAMRSHALLCSYAPRYLDPRYRQSWDQDAGAFSEWLSQFDQICARQSVLPAARLALEAVPLLKGQPRPPLLVIGFDRLLPFHTALLDAWGAWRVPQPGDRSENASFFAAADPDAEIAACASWCRQHITRDSDVHLLVIAPDVRSVRGELERALYREAALEPRLAFEFSLGVPLIQTGPARSAEMLLRWLDGELAENEIDWLVSSLYCAASPAETAGLLAGMRALRHRGLQRTHWKLSAFIEQGFAAKWPFSWTSRMRSAQERLGPQIRRTQNPAEWAETAFELLKIVSWPGASAASSAEFQAVEALRSAVETCGTLGFDGRRIPWRTFLSELRAVLENSLFAPQSKSAAILVTGPTESAGMRADAIWFLGADQDAWPLRGDLDPLIPPEIQRATAIPHAAAEDDWQLGEAITRRILAAAPEVCFSYPMQRDGVELRASALAASFVDLPRELPAERLPWSATEDITETIEDAAAIPYGPAANGANGPVAIKGGVGVLTAQSQCPFKAFATSRLGASGWDAAEQGLSAAERGKILHAILRSVWSGPPDGIRSSKELQQKADLRAFAAEHVRRVLPHELPARANDTMPARYLDLEAERLTRLIAEWLHYEKTRIEFEVIDTEEQRTRTIAGLSLSIRFDRLDRLKDHTVLVVDYKTGSVSPNVWDSDRPDDVQLPLYATYGIEDDELPGGLVFAKVSPGNMCFAGQVGDATKTIDPTLKCASALVKKPLSLEQLEAWRDTIEQLARDFLAGRAAVDPRDHATTCSRCELHAVCRIGEREACFDDDNGGEDHE